MKFFHQIVGHQHTMLTIELETRQDLESSHKSPVNCFKFLSFKYSTTEPPSCMAISLFRIESIQ